MTTPIFATDYNVYINHTDAGGIVYHANHLVFFENCRRDWFTKLGLNGYFLKTDSGEVQHFVVSQADLQYKRAILLDEVITVRIDKVELKPASIVFYQSIHRQQTNSPSSDRKNNESLLSSTKIV
ncbi:hotdog domain-containing protein, partial [Psychrobacter sp.]